MDTNDLIFQYVLDYCLLVCEYLDVHYVLEQVKLTLVTLEEFIHTLGELIFVDLIVRNLSELH